MSIFINVKSAIDLYHNRLDPLVFHIKLQGYDRTGVRIVDGNGISPLIKLLDQKILYCRRRVKVVDANANVRS